jgi:acyl-CoA dehydrogenase
MSQRNYRKRGDDGGISAFAIDGKAEGPLLEQRVEVSSLHTVGTWTLNDCRIPPDRLIGEPGQGLRIAMSVLELFRPTVGAAALGLAPRHGRGHQPKHPPHGVR